MHYFLTVNCKTSVKSWSVHSVTYYGTSMVTIIFLMKEHFSFLKYNVPELSKHRKRRSHNISSLQLRTFVQELTEIMDSSFVVTVADREAVLCCQAGTDLHIIIVEKSSLILCLMSIHNARTSPVLKRSNFILVFFHE